MSGFIDSDHGMSLLAQRQATIEELTKKLAQAENKLDRAIKALNKSEERHAERDIESIDPQVWDHLAAFNEGYTSGRSAAESRARDSKEGMDRAEGLSEDARQAAQWLLAQGMELFIARRLQEDMNTRATLEARVKELELEAAYWHKEYVAANTGERCASLEEEFRAKSAKGEP